MKTALLVLLVLALMFGAAGCAWNTCNQRTCKSPSSGGHVMDPENPVQNAANWFNQTFPPVDQ